MRRRLLTILSAVSLVLCVATAVLWVRSAWVTEALSFEGSGGYAWVGSTNGILHGHTGPLSSPAQFDGVKYEGASRSTFFGGRVADWLTGKFYFDRRASDGRRRAFIDVAVPYWLMVLLAAVTPAVWLWRRSKRPRAAGLCASCGYDLRATPGRCPECGKAVAGEKTPA